MLEAELYCQGQSVQEQKRKAGSGEGSLPPLLHIQLIMCEGCADASNIFIDLSDSAIQSEILVRISGLSSAFDLWYESVSRYDTGFIREIVLSLCGIFACCWKKHLIFQHC